MEISIHGLYMRNYDEQVRHSGALTSTVNFCADATAFVLK